MEIQIRGSETVFPEHLVLECKDENGRDLKVGN